MSQKITEKEVTQILLDNSHVLITQQEDDGSGQKVESLRRIPLPVFLQKCGGAGNENGQLDPEFVKQIVDNYLAANPPSVTETDPTVPAWAKAAEKPAYTAAEVGAISQEDLQAATDAALSQAKESGLFDGAPGADGSDGKDGADGYTPVKGTDYFTEADKQEIASSAAEMVPIPDVLPNPNALTFTGAVTGTYDGSAPLSVEIPSGGSGGGADYSFLNGLKYYALGDSITSMQGTMSATKTFGNSGYSTDLQNRDISDVTVDGYVTAIERRYGLVASNFGVGGQTLVSGYSSLVAKSYSDVALVTIAYGVNDARTGVPLGTVNSTDTTTFAGALNQLLRKIYTDNPECRVLVLSPMQRLTVTEFGIATPNANGNYLIDFVNMCKAIAEKRATAFLDQYRCTGINQTNLYYYTVEGVHPVNQGFARIRNAVIGILDKLFALEYDPIGVMTNAGDTEPEEPNTGGNTGSEEPPTEETGATVVDIADQFTRYGIDMDGWGTGISATDSTKPYRTARYHPESNVTYTIVSYGEAKLLTATDRRMWSFTTLNDDGSIKSGNYIYSASGERGAADTYESVTIDGVEYAKMTKTIVTGDVADNNYWNIPCITKLIGHVSVSYI